MRPLSLLGQITSNAEGEEVELRRIHSVDWIKRDGESIVQGVNHWIYTSHVHSRMDVPERRIDPLS